MGAVTITLADLLTAETQDEIKARLLAGLNANGFPITDWSSGAVERTTVEAFALAYRDLTGNLIPEIAGGGFLDDASTDWLTFLAKRLYYLDRVPATQTVQRITLTVAAGNGPYTITVGQLVFESTAGRRYQNTEAATLSLVAGNPLGTVTVLAASESPNDSTNPATNYIDGPGTITTMVTPLPGVTCNNAAADFSPTLHLGNGTGTVASDRTSSVTTPDPHTFRVTITKTGQISAGAATYRLDGTGPEISIGGVIPATFDLPGGTTVYFANGAINPSFYRGDTYTFSTPGSPVVVQGRDEERDPALRGRCRARWPALAAIPTADNFELWAKSADAQVTKVTVRPSATIAGRADITIAGHVNPLPGIVQTAVQAYINARTGILDIAVVSIAVTLTVGLSPAGIVTVPIGATAAVKVALDALWSSYITDLPMGGIARLAKLQQFILEAGATDHQLIAFLDGGPDVNYQLGPNNVASVDGYSPSQVFTFVEA